MPAVIEAVEYMLPANTETIEDIAASYPNWPLERIASKTGIRQRHIADENECASDLGTQAANCLLARIGCDRADIDYLLVITQTPDYQLPTTACLLQDRLGLGTHIGALDINLGCSGYIYALGVAKALVESGQARRLLLITADTYSKFINPGDKSVRALFGDGASATLISQQADTTQASIGPFEYGTDGSGGQCLVVPNSGMRNAHKAGQAVEEVDRHDNTRSADDLYMHGRSIVEFTLREVPGAVQRLCNKAGIELADIDAVVPHQASAMVLHNIRARLGLPEDRFIINMENTGNTVSSSIPIALMQALRSGQLQPGALLLLVGFGVGLSWGATLVRLPENMVVD